MKDRGLMAGLVFAAVVIILVAVGSIVFGSDPKGATKTLEDQGYTNVKITGYRVFMGSDDDFYSTGFEATSPAGNHVTGAVTGGPFKGNTIRFD